MSEHLQFNPHDYSQEGHQEEPQPVFFDKEKLVALFEQELLLGKSPETDQLLHNFIERIAGKPADPETLLLLWELAKHDVFKEYSPRTLQLVNGLLLPVIHDLCADPEVGRGANELRLNFELGR